MRVTLTQSSNEDILRGWILLRIEADHICTQIWTSSTFNPYQELYIWLGQIRDSQLPAKMIIDEEGHGVEMIVECLSDLVVQLRIEPWMCGNDTTTRLKITASRYELLKAFHDGVIKFLQDEYQPSQWSYIDDLSNTNWGALLKPSNISGQNWRIRLAMHWGGRDRVSETGRETVWNQLTPLQQWLVILHDVMLWTTDLTANGQITEAYALVSLYKNLPIDIALDEFDASWYSKRRIELNKQYGLRENFIESRTPYNRSASAIARLKTLKLGQLVDGTIHKIKSYGVFVNIGGYYALLHITTISQQTVEHPQQVFQVGEWVRAIITWIDVEKGRVSLSTSDLEVEPGDMLKDPLRVYEKAEEMAAKYYQKIVLKLESE
ncbi:ribosomal protein S1 [Nostoc commune NIES-4072]|uniref:Ribosomal protein S1 n=1 Tax=Nostoc commune NIES-4072 TaxID=2005467 RepID=A0A2R5G060_NOSCO|nr:S1 RNA-binding domain-containing protein [Nostoc commune]BBD70958.1 ribosomal protein S1 [Nostoc commune HK-02]GBG23679.1 ribosomal protein S1 [Nostoc commune NIES-4072]